MRYNSTFQNSETRGFDRRYKLVEGYYIKRKQ